MAIYWERANFVASRLCCLTLMSSLAFDSLPRLLSSDDDTLTESVQVYLGRTALDFICNVSNIRTLDETRTEFPNN